MIVGYFTHQKHPRKQRTIMAKFRKGQKVRHKVSGEPFVVLDPDENGKVRCQNGKYEEVLFDPSVLEDAEHQEQIGRSSDDFDY